MLYSKLHGEMSERFKEPVLKTGDAETHRGFESHSLRHMSAVIQVTADFLNSRFNRLPVPFDTEISGTHPSCPLRLRTFNEFFRITKNWLTNPKLRGMIQLAEVIGKYGRVVELVDSLDSGSSVHCGRAGSSPASPTKSTHGGFVMSAFFLQKNKNALNDPQKMLPENKVEIDSSRQ